MSTQSEALLGLVNAYQDLHEAERVVRAGELWANPIICTPLVYQLAWDAANATEREMLRELNEQSLLVIADDPHAERARLAGLRPGYMNRSARRAGKRGKRK